MLVLNCPESYLEKRALLLELCVAAVAAEVTLRVELHEVVVVVAVNRTRVADAVVLTRFGGTRAARVERLTRLVALKMVG